MADSTSTDGQRSERLVAFHVKNVDRDGTEKSFWTRIGVAFPHKDGKGYNVTLDLLPPSGEVVLRKPDPDPDAQAQ